MAETIKIGGELESVATGGIVAAASAIKDKTKNKTQEQVNAKTDETLAAHSSAISGFEGGNFLTLVATNADADIAAVFTRLSVTPAVNTIYRIANWKHNDADTKYNTAYYSEYAANGTTTADLVPISVENKGIDDVPTAESENLIKSGGVQNELALGAVYDVSAKNPTAGPNNDGKFTLEYILDQNNVNTLIPTAVRKGGMSIKFVQSSDNNYVQFFCTADEFTTDVTQWQGVDNTPTYGSDNLIKSGGVYPIKLKSLEFDNILLDENFTINAGTTHVAFNIETLQKGQYGYILLAGTSASVRFGTSNYDVLANYQVTDGDKKFVKIPINSPKLLIYPDDTSSKIKGHISVVYGDVVNTIIEDEVSEPKIMDTQYATRKQCRVDGAFKIKAATRFCIHEVWECDENGSNQIIIANNDFSRTEYQTNKISHYNIYFAKTDNTIIYPTDKIIDYFKLTSEFINAESVKDNNVSIILDSFNKISANNYRVILSLTQAVEAQKYGYLYVKGISGFVEFDDSSYNLFASYDFTDGIYSQVIIPEGTTKILVNTTNKTVVAVDTPFHMEIGYDTLLNKIHESKDKEIADVKLLQNKIGYYNNEDYASFTNLDLSKIKMYRGSISYDTGEVINHTRRLYSEFMPIKPLSKLSVSTYEYNGLRYDIIVFFYKVNDDGSYSWQSQYTFNSNYTHNYAASTSSYPSFETIVPPTCNAMRFFITNESITLDDSHFNSNYLSIACHTRSTFKEIKNQYTEINGVIKLSDIGEEWVQGLGFTEGVIADNRCKLCNVFKVHSGQRIEFCNGNSHFVDRVNIEFYANIEVSSAPTSTMQFSASYIPVRTVPIGINYMRVYARINTAGHTLTPANCVSDNWHLIDVTGELMNLQHSELVIDTLIPRSQGWSYAQGMAIQNGYIFNGVADSYIDIYDLETKELIQSIFIDPSVIDPSYPKNIYHFNQLTFGDKYDDNDEFGILWADCDTAVPEVCHSVIGLRVIRSNNTFTLTKVYLVDCPARPADEAGTCRYFDFKNKRMAISSYVIDENITYPEQGWTDSVLSYYSWEGEFNEETVFTFEKSFRLPIIFAMQGGILTDGILYLVSGSWMNNINVFNMMEGKWIGAIDLRRECFNITHEAQAIAFADGLYISSTSSSTHQWWLHKLYL